MNSRKCIPAALLGLAAATVLAGCGSSGGSAAPAAAALSADAAPGPTCDGKTTPVKAAMAQGMDVGIVYLGAKQGFFAEHCLEVDVTTVAAPAAALASVVGGSADISYAPTVSIVNAAANGVDLKAFAPGDGFPADAGTAQADGYDTTGVYVPKGSGITSAADLAGKSISVPARYGMLEMGIAQAIREAGGDPSAVQWVKLDPATALQQLDAKQIDAAAVVPPTSFEAAAAGDTRVIAPTLSLFGPDSTYVVWYTSAKTASAKSTQIAQFRDAINQSQAYAMAHPDEFQAAWAEGTKTPLEVIQRGNPEIYYHKALRESDFSGIADRMKSLGYIDSVPDMSGIIEN